LCYFFGDALTNGSKVNMRSQSKKPDFDRLDGRARLREATRAVHERLHVQPAMAALASGAIDLPAYRALLGRLYGFHAPLENLLAASEWAERAELQSVLSPRAKLLRDDLLDLGADESAVEGLPKAAASMFPNLSAYGHLVGCLYVRAGSTLGGRLLSRALDPLLGPDTQLGRRFLAGGNGADVQWRQCCVAIEQATAEGHWDDMLTGVNATFAALESWLNSAA
jgi:heme oxygenase